MTDNIQRLLVTLGILVLSSMACGQYVTPLPDNTPTTLPPTLTETVVQTPTTVSTTVTTPVWTATVSQVQVNVRDEPDGNTVIGYLVSGDEVVISRCVGDWCKIKEPVVGWIFKGCLSIGSDLGCSSK